MKQEAMKLALDELNHIKQWCLRSIGIGLVNENVLAAIEEALAQDMPKIGCVNHDCDKCKEQIIQSYLEKDNSQQLTWVGLTDDEVDDAARYCVKSGQSVNAAIRGIEAKLKEKNT